MTHAALDYAARMVATFAVLAAWLFAFTWLLVKAADTDRRESD